MSKPLLLFVSLYHRNKQKMELKVNYTFEYPNGKQVLSGGNAGTCIVGDIDHTKTNINDNVKIVQFNYSGSFPSIAKIIGIHKFNWDMTKPIGKRKLNEIRLGTYEN